MASAGVKRERDAAAVLADEGASTDEVVKRVKTEGATEGPSTTAAEQVQADTAAAAEAGTAAATVPAAPTATGEEQPAKRLKADPEAAAGPAEAAAAPAAVSNGPSAAIANGPETGNAEGSCKDPPRKIGYLTFASGQDALDYFYKVTSTVRHNQDLNEYERTMALELLKTGHPDAPRKLAPGIKAIQVRDVDVHDFSTSCFHLVRPDGSAEDFSTRKCLATLFPLFGASPKMTGTRHHKAGNRGGRGRGARGGNRSRGQGRRGRRS